jgi:hypothetical protein
VFIHNVYFWLKPDLTPAQKETYLKGVRALTTIPSVTFGFVGSPASTDRPIIDRSYSYMLVVAFEDKAGHDLYQEHPIHDAFRNDCGTFWNKVLIYDAVD